MNIQRINNLLRKLQPFAEKFIDQLNIFCNVDETIDYVDTYIVTEEDLGSGLTNRLRIMYRDFYNRFPLFIIECDKNISNMTDKLWEFFKHYGLVGKVFLNQHNLHTFVFPLGEKIKQYLEED